MNATQAPATERDALLSGAAQQAEARRLSASHRRLVRRYVTTRLRSLDEVLDPASREAMARERAALRAWFDRQPGRWPRGNRSERAKAPEAR